MIDARVGAYLTELHKTTAQQSGVAYDEEDQAAMMEILRVAIVLAINGHRSPQ